MDILPPSSKSDDLQVTAPNKFLTASQVSPQELTDDELVSEFQRISSTSMQTPLELAALCARKKTFKAQGKALRILRLSPAKFSKLRQIGQNNRLADLTLTGRLPPTAGYSILYSLCQLSDEKMDKALRDGIISPSITRSQIENIREDKPTNNRRTRLRRKPFAVVIAPQDIDRATKQALCEKLVELCDQFGATLDAAMTPISSQLCR